MNSCNRKKILLIYLSENGDMYWTCRAVVGCRGGLRYLTMRGLQPGGVAFSLFIIRRWGGMWDIYDLLGLLRSVKIRVPYLFLCGIPLSRGSKTKPEAGKF